MKRALLLLCMAFLAGCATNDPAALQPFVIDTPLINNAYRVSIENVCGHTLRNVKLSVYVTPFRDRRLRVVHAYDQIAEWPNGKKVFLRPQAQPDRVLFFYHTPAEIRLVGSCSEGEIRQTE